LVRSLAVDDAGHRHHDEILDIDGGLRRDRRCAQGGRREHEARSPKCLQHALESKPAGGQTATISRMSESPAKSSGFRVKGGGPAARAVAAINKSPARRPRALRPAAPTAAYTRP